MRSYFVNIESNVGFHVLDCFWFIPMSCLPVRSFLFLQDAVCKK